MANFSAQGGKEHGSRKIKVMFNAASTHPSPGAALCRCGSVVICASEPKEFQGAFMQMWSKMAEVT